MTLCAWMSVTVGQMAFTMQTFGVFLTVLLLGGGSGTAACCVYLLLGALGLPVFSGFQGGIGVLLGPTGGYLFGFLATALIYWLVTALGRDKEISRLLGMVLGLLGISIPNFWMGLMLIIWLSLRIKLFPSGGMGGWKSVVLPAFTLGIDYIASLSRTTRSSMIDVIRQDYLRTARSKGVSEKKVTNKHALKNALIPIVTVSGSQLAGILGGSVTTETVFAWPGVGRLIVEAISYRDVKLATGALIMTTILSSIILLSVDILYAYIDPRLKAQYAGRRKKK
jgi:peptide/nickel transport system permease protein